MKRDDAASDIDGPAYVAWFAERCFGEACEVEVVAFLKTKHAKIEVSWRPFFGPPLSVSFDDLRVLSTCIGSLVRSAHLLREPIAESLREELRCEQQATSLRVIQPKGKAAMYSLSAGPLHRVGPLEKLSSKEIDDVIARLEALKAQVLEKASQLVEDMPPETPS